MASLAIHPLDSVVTGAVEAVRRLIVAQPQSVCSWSAHSSPGVSVQARDWLADYAADSRAVREFSAQHNLLAALAEVIRRANTDFPRVRRLVLSVEADPEDGRTYLLLDVTSAGPLSEALDGYRKYIADLVAVLPPGPREFLRTSYYTA